MSMTFAEHWTRHGIEQGLEKGLEQGLEKGQAETKRNIADKMLADGVDPKFVRKYIPEADLKNISK